MALALGHLEQQPGVDPASPAHARPTVLEEAAREAIRFYEELEGAHVAARAVYGRLNVPLPQTGSNAVEVFDDLIRDTQDGLVGAGGPRFFGWVIGGSLPSAIAADWMVSTWDQNGATYQCSPAAAVLEEVAGEWLKDQSDKATKQERCGTTSPRSDPAPRTCSSRGEPVNSPLPLLGGFDCRFDELFLFR